MRWLLFARVCLSLRQNNCIKWRVFICLFLSFFFFLFGRTHSFSLSSSSSILSCQFQFDQYAFHCQATTLLIAIHLADWALRQQNKECVWKDPSETITIKIYGLNRVFSRVLASHHHQMICGWLQSYFVNETCCYSGIAAIQICLRLSFAEFSGIGRKCSAIWIKINSMWIVLLISVGREVNLSSVNSWAMQI